MFKISNVSVRWFIVSFKDSQLAKYFREKTYKHRTQKYRTETTKLGAYAKSEQTFKKAKSQNESGYLIRDFEKVQFALVVEYFYKASSWRNILSPGLKFCKCLKKYSLQFQKYLQVQFDKKIREFLFEGLIQHTVLVPQIITQ